MGDHTPDGHQTTPAGAFGTDHLPEKAPLPTPVFVTKNVFEQLCAKVDLHMENYHADKLEAQADRQRNVEFQTTMEDSMERLYRLFENAQGGQENTTKLTIPSNEQEQNTPPQEDQEPTNSTQIQSVKPTSWRKEMEKHYRQNKSKKITSKLSVFLLSTSDKTTGVYYISTKSRIKQLKSSLERYTNQRLLLITKATDIPESNLIARYFPTHKLVKSAPVNMHKLKQYLRKTEQSESTWAGQHIQFREDIYADTADIISSQNSQQINYKKRTSLPNRRDTIGVPSRHSLQPINSSTDSDSNSDKNTNNTHKTNSTNSSSESSDTDEDSEPSDSDNSDTSKRRKRKRKKRKAKEREKQKEITRAVQEKMKILNTVRQTMQQKHKYAGNTNKTLEVKLYAFMVFHTDVTNVMEGVDVTILFKNKQITQQEIFKMITEDMTIGYAKTILLELQQEAKLKSDAPDNHNWEKVTTNLETYFTYVASQVFNEQEIMKMKSTLFTIPKGQFNISTLYFKVHIIYVVSKLLAPRFSCDPINEATAAEAFMKSLNQKIENILTMKMNQEEYTFTTAGILRWFRKIGEQTEQRLFPKGYEQPFTPRLNTLKDNGAGSSALETIPDLISASESEFSDADEEQQYLAYMNNDRRKRLYKNRNQYRNDNRNRQFNQDRRPRPSDNKQIYALDTIENINNQLQQLQQQTLQFQQGSLPPRPPANTNPSLVPPQITHDVRMEWLRDRKCLNCGSPSCSVKQCQKPKDMVAIRKVFDVLKNKRTATISELHEMEESLSQLYEIDEQNKSETQPNPEEKFNHQFQNIQLEDSDSDF